MIQIMQQLQIGNQSMGQALSQQQEQLNQQREASQQQMQRLEMMVTNISQRGSGVVDVRQVGKPDFTKGSKDQIGKQWPDWMYTFETWFCSQFRDAEKALRWAREEGGSSITSQDIEQQGHDFDWPELGKINAQLQVALVSLCRDEALTVVRNSERGQGLDAWRRLNREYEPNNPQANLRLLKKVLQPAQQSIDTLRVSIETWEREYKMYSDRSGEAPSDAIQRLTLQSMAPPSLQEHLDFHAGRLVTYNLLKAEIDLCLDVKQSAQAGGAVPMDVDAQGQVRQGQIWQRHLRQGRRQVRQGQGPILRQQRTTVPSLRRSCRRVSHRMGLLAQPQESFTRCSGQTRSEGQWQMERPKRKAQRRWQERKASTAKGPTP